jgi:hypothetical protein
MAKKNKKNDVTAVTAVTAPIQKVVEGMVELTANNGSLNKYGKRNLLRHGRHAQGGQIDQLCFKSFLTGQEVTFADCETLVLTEAVSNPLTPSRIDSHLQHLVGSHGFKVLINPVKKTFQVVGIGEYKEADIKSACDIL